MKLRIVIYVIITEIFTISLNAQEYITASDYLNSRNEVYFKFKLDENLNFDDLSKNISIDNIYEGYVFTYANSKEFTFFLDLNIEYEVLTPPSLLYQESFLKSTETTIWAKYPAYEEYISMMESFETNFPDICKLYEIGKSINNRKLLFAKISDNVNVKEAEPEFMYSSTMHGDETAGYVLMLRLIDYILNNYNSDTLVKYLVDNIEIWINPLSNPDGTYYAGNSTVVGAKRYNANSIDLNRNFPDPDNGPHPDKNEYQPENICMMNFMQNHNFILSANIHGGAEVINYPWDTWLKRHIDDTWFQHISREYADEVRKTSNYAYFLGFEDGITNGYDWYSISGGRQDYVTGILHGREVTIEISNQKIPSGDYLEDLWQYNSPAFLNYIKQSLNGIQGIVKDSVSEKPICSKIVIENHDDTLSYIYSNSVNGNFHRLIEEGIYHLTFTANNYDTLTLYNVQVFWDKPTNLNVRMFCNNCKNDTTHIKDSIPNNDSIPKNDSTLNDSIKNNINIITEKDILISQTSGYVYIVINEIVKFPCKIDVYDVIGNLIFETQNTENKINKHYVKLPGKGIYIINVTASQFRISKKILH